MLKAGDLVSGDTKLTGAWQGEIVQQILTEKHPAWLVRWETRGERVQWTRSIKKRDRDPELIEVEINEEEALTEDNLLEALEGLSEHIGEVSEGSDTDDDDSVDDFGYFLWYNG